MSGASMSAGPFPRCMIHGQFVAAGPDKAISGFMEVKMTRRLTDWETTRLSKHFILLDFLAGRAIYRSCKPLVFDEVWEDDEHGPLARDLCNELLEPLIAAYGPISVADAFWPRAVADASWPSALSLGHAGSRKGKHRWENGEATADIALYSQVDEGKTGKALKEAVDGLSEIDGCRGRVLCYPDTEFLCVTFRSDGPSRLGSGWKPKKPQRNMASTAGCGRSTGRVTSAKGGCVEVTHLCRQEGGAGHCGTDRGFP